MSHSQLQAALARERHTVLLAQAAAARQARRARPNRPGRARAHRPGRATPAIRRSLSHPFLGWLPPWIRLLTRGLSP